MSSKYLAIGSNVAKKYEVIDVLGEDEFEILYLVRDLHRKGSFFVLKELFLETFSSRNHQSVFTIPEAEGVFNKRKQQIIEEVEVQKLNLNFCEIKTYGYEEDHGTIYTIMEFSNNASLEKYLHYASSDKNSLPTLDELLKNEKKSKSSFFLLKLLLLMGSIIAMVFYAYQYFSKDNMERSLEKLETSLTLEHPKLIDRTNVMDNNPIVEHTSKMEPLIEILVNKKDTNISTQSVVLDEVKKDISLNVVIEHNETIQGQSVEIDKIEENTTKISDENLSTNIAEDINQTLLMENAIKSFLDEYIGASSSSSVSATLKYYEKRLKKYFKIKNATYTDIMNAQEKYNKKWVKRKFEIVDFEIVKSYQENNVDFYDVKTITVWEVSNSRGKKFSGKSRGFMTLKKVSNGFKITSIHTIK